LTVSAILNIHNKDVNRFYDTFGAKIIKYARQLETFIPKNQRRFKGNRSEGFDFVVVFSPDIEHEMRADFSKDGVRISIPIHITGE